MYKRKPPTFGRRRCLLQGRVLICPAGVDVGGEMYHAHEDIHLRILMSFAKQYELVNDLMHLLLLASRERGLVVDHLLKDGDEQLSESEGKTAHSIQDGIAS